MRFEIFININTELFFLQIAYMTVTGDKKKVVEELKAEAKEAETVWLASDEDREGEAIAWHLYEVLKLQPEHTKRIVFHEITQSAILKAIEQPRNIDINLVDAQQARRILDRIVGFELSPVLWKKVKPALSAGRVQSVAVQKFLSFGFGLDTARQLGFHFHRFAVGIGHEEYGGHPVRCFRLESLYLALAFYDKTDCYRLHTPGRECGFHFFPQYG